MVPLSSKQSQRLFLLLAKQNPGLEEIWPDLAGTSDAQDTLVPDVDFIAIEGAPRLVQHLSRERNTELVRAKEAQVLQQTGRLACECCGFDFEEFYGPRGKDFCEVHHLRPLGSAKGQQRTKLDDLAIVCSNCHRVIHHPKPMLTIKRLAKIVRVKRGQKA